MERFLQERNVVLYRRLRNSSDETERRMIINLLVEEMAKLKMGKNEHQQDKFARRSNSEYVR
jgi:hypothetical protein